MPCTPHAPPPPRPGALAVFWLYPYLSAFICVAFQLAVSYPFEMIAIFPAVVLASLVAAYASLPPPLPLDAKLQEELSHGPCVGMARHPHVPITPQSHSDLMAITLWRSHPSHRFMR